MNSLLLGMMVGLKLGVFSTFLMYTHLAHKTTDVKFIRLFYPIAIAFLVIALSEAAFVLSVVTEHSIPPLVSNQDNLYVISNVMYLVAASFATLFVTYFHRGVKED